MEPERAGEEYRLWVLREGDAAAQVNTGWIKGVSQTFNRLWLASTIKARRNNGNWSTGYIENLTMSSLDTT